MTVLNVPCSSNCELAIAWNDGMAMMCRRVCSLGVITPSSTVSS
ncbi:MAG: hypothetical protein BWZ10_00577 [candidate division BRC1 bacterium ADurb.BinA364]|nr:MAG: hypothetical protein BWZ10_00577 [candidate division BRC1 bacterium ADurb.BinA364]